MSYKVITYKMAPEYPMWGTWTNTYHFNLPEPIQFDNVAMWTTRLMDFERSLHFNQVVLIGAVWIKREDGAKQGQMPEARFAFYGNGQQRGERPLFEEMRYRWVLRIPRQTKIGHSSGHNYHGCINRRDLIVDGRDRITLHTAPEFFYKVEAHKALHQQDLWQYHEAQEAAGLFGGPAQYGPAGPMIGALPVDVHAQTRLRQRTVPDSIYAFNAYFKMVSALRAVAVEVTNEIAVQTTYIYPDFYEHAIGALGGMKSEGTKVQEYLRGKYPDKDGELQEVKQRFGTTRASILGAISKGQEFNDVELPEMQGQHKPQPGPGGDMFISPDDLKPYRDSLQDWEKAVAGGLDFDWWNPYAVPRVGEREMPKLRGDIQELLL